MYPRLCKWALCGGLVASSAALGQAVRGQNVFVDIVPLGGTIVNPGPQPTVLVQPGAAIPYEIVLLVEADPTFAETGGLASFDLNVLTNVGVVQNDAFNFSPGISPLFSTGLSPGTVLTDDIIGIAAAQNVTNATGEIVTGFGLNQAQQIGVGQILTPTFEGDFQVGLTGTADLFSLGGTRVTTVPGVLANTPGFIIQTRFQEATEPDVVEPDPTPVPPTPLPPLTGGSSGPVNPLPGEQVASEDPGPTVAGVLTPGVCGFGAFSALAATL